MRKAVFGSVVAVFVAALGTALAAPAQAKSSCEPEDPISALLPKVPCPGTGLILSDRSFCDSCAIKKQSMAAKDAVAYADQKLEVLVGNALSADSFKDYYRGYMGSPDYSHFKKAEADALVVYKDAWQSVNGLKQIAENPKPGEWIPKNVSDRANADLASATRRLQAVREDFKKKTAPQIDDWYRQYQRDTVKKFQTPEVKERLDKLARDKYCANGVRVSWARIEGMTVTEYEGEGLPPREKADEHQQDLKESYDQDLRICSDPVPMRSRLAPVEQVETLSVPASDFFADNQTALDSQKTANILKALDSRLGPTGKKDCIQKIKSVQILTSSNQKANSGRWEANGQQWDFLALSEGRARTLQSVIGKHLVEASKKGRVQLAGDPLAENGITKLDFWGEHGDGSSGICPYRIEEEKDSKGDPSGMYRVIPDQGVWNSAEMNESKYAQIEIETDEVGPGCTRVEGAKKDEKEVSYIGSKCFEPKLECR